jgi:hypothetical protein
MKNVKMTIINKYIDIINSSYIVSPFDWIIEKYDKSSVIGISINSSYLPLIGLKN